MYIEENKIISGENAEGNVEKKDNIIKKTGNFFKNAFKNMAENTTENKEEKYNCNYKYYISITKGFVEKVTQLFMLFKNYIFNIFVGNFTNHFKMIKMFSYRSNLFNLFI